MMSSDSYMATPAPGSSMYGTVIFPPLACPSPRPAPRAQRPRRRRVAPGPPRSVDARQGRRHGRGRGRGRRELGRLGGTWSSCAKPWRAPGHGRYSTVSASSEHASRTLRQKGEPSYLRPERRREA
jgi:hypothetical protein